MDEGREEVVEVEVDDEVVETTRVEVDVEVAVVSNKQSRYFSRNETK